MSVKDPVQVRLSGAGGQGLITAGIILAEAALIDGKNVVQTQTYGPEARLGSSRSEVIISTGKIAYPQVTVPDVLLCLSLEAARKFMPQAPADAMVILDSTFIGTDVTGRSRIHRLPITEAAVKAGSKVVANTVALWVLNELAQLVSPGSLVEAITVRVPERFRKLNEQAIDSARRLLEATQQPA
jgi:2-oxoglutarate ferredoxin oxidoreductase subunit gamma